MADDDSLLTAIGTLLAGAESRDDPAQLERTLMDGYARALALEAERRRLQRRIESLTVAPGGSGTARRRQLASLIGELDAHARDIDALREQLGRLRRRHSSAVRARS